MEKFFTHIKSSLLFYSICWFFVSIIVGITMFMAGEFYFESRHIVHHGECYKQFPLTSRELDCEYDAITERLATLDQELAERAKTIVAVVDFSNNTV